MASLTLLDVTKNQIVELPLSMVDLKSLSTLSVDQNPLQLPPASVSVT